ncbi:MAG TPA: TetR/AcrR family transcriptional regulator [Candidatus Kryptonia bacterium]|nr:TetR/AcrR family transcriptional regulator [Candidatus Kryptonia bacterium]
MPATVAQLPAPTRGRPPIVGLRQTILQAAAETFARHDYHEVLMDDVARACDVGKGTLYRYFPGKRELYVAVMFEGIERLRAELQAAVDTPGSPVGKIERIVHCILAHFWDRRYFFALIYRNEHKPDDPDTREWLRRRTELSRVVQRAVRQAIAAGHLRAVDSRIATEMLFGMLRGANRYRTAHDRLEPMVAAVVDMFLRGIGTRAGQRVATDGSARRP